jgi:hypothetical protein
MTEAEQNEKMVKLGEDVHTEMNRRGVKSVTITAGFGVKVPNKSYIGFEIGGLRHAMVYGGKVESADDIATVFCGLINEFIRDGLLADRQVKSS